MVRLVRNEPMKFTQKHRLSLLLRVHGEEKEGRAEEEAAAQLPEALEKSREPRRSQRAAPLGAGGLRASS